MLLQTAAIFAGLGIAFFVIGLVFDRPELALFGAIIVIGVGGTGVVQGYQVAVGENVTIENVSSNTTVETSETTYEDVTAISSFPLEIIVLLLGAIMLISSAGEASETGREGPPWRRR